MTTGAPTPTSPQPVLASSGFYFSDTDHLLLTSWNSLAGVTLTMTGRFLRVDGSIEPFLEVHTPNTNRTAASSTFRRGEGWLLDLSIVVTAGAPVRGQTFVRVDIIRGLSAVAFVLSTVVQGYVTATKRLAYPGSPLEDSLAGQGALRSVLGTDPAANTEIAEAVPTGARWRLQSITFSLVSDGTAANREVSIVVDDGTNVLFTSPSTFAQTATLTRRYSAAALGALSAPAQATERQIVLPPLVLLAGWRVTTVTTNIQATDNYGAPRLAVEEWLEAA